MPGKYWPNTANRHEIQLTRNSPEPGIVTERVARRRLGNAGQTGRVPDRFLNNRFVQVSMSETRSGIEVMGGSGKHPLPGPLAAGIRVLSNQGVRGRRSAQSPFFKSASC